VIKNNDKTKEGKAKQTDVDCATPSPKAGSFEAFGCTVPMGTWSIWRNSSSASGWAQLIYGFRDAFFQGPGNAGVRYVQYGKTYNLDKGRPRG
jgi:hypothetical protein